MPIPDREVPGYAPHHDSPNKAMTRKRNLVKNSSRVRRQRDPIPFKYCLLTAVCGLFLLAGFFAAANFHFCSVSTAMENSDLRKELNKLKGENRKLVVKRVSAASPQNIATLAKPMGFAVTTASVPIRNSEIASAKPVRVSHDTSKTKVQKTISSKSVKSSDVQKPKEKLAKTNTKTKDERMVASLSETEILMGDR